jgi:AraC family transcriptional regulator, regulatory protein of adaptative response / methylated-DNA-[protein]-cysteine methyltransferase
MIPNKKDTLVIQQTTMPCSLGWFIAAATDTGVCFMALGDDPDILLGELKKRFAHARLTVPSREFKTTVERLAASIEKPARKCEISLDLHGTLFQKQVWQGLTTIPAGSTLPYKELAKRIGHPGSARAVANACGANPVAVVIPCHRVIRSDGSPGGYRWGIDRKEKLLSLEQNTPTQENQS